MTGGAPQDAFTPDLTRYFETLPRIKTIKQHGRVSKIVGLIIESEGPAVMMGEMCLIVNPRGGVVRSEVVGFKGNIVQLMPLGDLGGVGPGSEVRATGKPLMVKVGWNLLGRVLDGLGEPIDGLGPLDCENEVPIYAEPPNPFLRPLGIAYVDVSIPPGTAEGIAKFYSQIARAPVEVLNAEEGKTAVISAGPFQQIRFVERELADYSTHSMHISYHVTNYNELRESVAAHGSLMGSGHGEVFFFDKLFDPGWLFSLAGRGARRVPFPAVW